MTTQLPLSLGSHALPAWLDDEALYSWAARFHFRSGSRLPRTTSSLLFGHPFAGIRHDFPSNLRVFVERTQGLLGSVETLIQKRTLLPYFLIFRSVDEGIDAFETLSGPLISGLKFRLGLITGRLRAALPLKACNKCIKDDLAEHGSGCWHRQHQWPGNWWCLRHDHPIDECAIKINGVMRFQYMLPERSEFRSASSMLSLEPSNTASSLRNLARIINGFTSIEDGSRLNIEQVRRTFIQRLIQMELAGPTGRLHLPAIEKSFKSFFEPFRDIVEFQTIGGTSSFPRTIVHLLRPQRSCPHPRPAGTSRSEDSCPTNIGAYAPPLALWQSRQ